MEVPFTFLVVSIAVIVAYLLGFINGRGATAQNVPTEPVAAPTVDLEQHQALLGLLRKCDKLIWMMATEVGGKVTIREATDAAYDPAAAMMIYGHDTDGETTVEAVTRSGN